MSAVIRLNKKGLCELIDSINGNGGDATELEALLAEVNEDEENHRPVKRMGAPLRVIVEDPTTEERLEAKVGGLFVEGITEKVLADVVEFDRNHTLEEIKELCVEAGISSSGSKKEMAAKLLARGVT